ncbi:hypothetical protein BT69DRAFT_1330961 [Atractiella rhizophila]|nr:hypothetical protein BT69DRAFT_1330961 [Atractiella rhizophila]
MSTILTSIASSSALFSHPFPYTPVISTAALFPPQTFEQHCIRDPIPSELLLFKPSEPRAHGNGEEPLEDEEDGIWPTDVRAKTPRKRGVAALSMGGGEEGVGRRSTVGAGRRSVRTKSLGVGGGRTGDGMEDCERNLAEAARLLDICPIPHLQERVHALTTALSSVKSSISRSEQILNGSSSSSSSTALSELIAAEEASIAALEREVEQARQAAASRVKKKAVVPRQSKVGGIRAKQDAKGGEIDEISSSRHAQQEERKKATKKPLTTEEEEELKAFAPSSKLGTKKERAPLTKDQEEELAAFAPKPKVASATTSSGLTSVDVAEETQKKEARTEEETIKIASSATQPTIEAEPTTPTTPITPAPPPLLPPAPTTKTTSQSKPTIDLLPGLTSHSLSRAIARIQHLHPSLPSSYSSLLPLLPQTTEGMILRTLLQHHFTSSSSLPVHVKPSLSASLLGGGGEGDGNEALVSMDGLKAFLAAGSGSGEGGAVDGGEVTKAVYRLVGRRVLRIDRKGREALVGFA